MLSALNKQQQQAVCQTEGQMLILAGAGSGKTRVLTTKIAYLIREKKVSAHRILAITFTNKAAREMKERVASLLPEVNVDTLWIGTFHSICARILRYRIDRIGYNRSFTIYDRDDQKSVLKAAMKELNTSEESLGVKLSSVIASISNHKNRRITPEELEASQPKFGFLKVVALLYPVYEKKLKESSALDFDDLILKTLELFAKDKETLQMYQERFEYVFVDEYQDTNRMQYDLIRDLSGYHQRVCVVGDIDQSIYKFRGADIKNILDFEKDYPDATMVKLEQNYRSTQNILNIANRMIENNTERKEKVLWTDNGKGKQVRYYQCLTSDEEASRVVRWIDLMRYDGMPLNEMAILYRTNAQSRSFEDQLRRESIPYQLIGGLKFYDRKEIKDISAYLQAIVNPSDSVSIQRIINVPKRGIGKTTLDRVLDWSSRMNLPFRSSLEQAGVIPGVGAAMEKRIDGFLTILKELEELSTQLSLTEFVMAVIDKSGYGQMLKETGLIEDLTRLENLNELVSSIAEYEEQNPEATIAEYLQEVSLYSDTDKTEGQSGVSLMTIHSAKGTEFDTVFVTGMEQGLFPSQRAMDEGELEEERRLCYVAITRARKELILTSAQSRRQYGTFCTAMPSVFIGEMGDALQIDGSLPTDHEDSALKGSEKADLHVKRLAEKRRERERQRKVSQSESFQAGDRIIHPIWGEGMVVMAQNLPDGEQNLTLSFADIGIKKVKKNIARLTRK